jgi:tetratricopeptide (TPR) repeat protein
MSAPIRHPVTLLLAALVLGAACLPALAQSTDDTDPANKAVDVPMSGSAAAASARARAKREAAKQKAAAEPAKYPQATREEPATQASAKGSQTLQQLVADYDAQKYDQVMADATAFAASTDNHYEQSFAYQLAGAAASDAGDDAKAADFFTRTLASNGLGNNGHYQVMYNLAVLQYGMDKYPEALATLDRFLTETKAETPEALGLKAAILNGMDKPADAAAIYEKLATLSPDDPRYVSNAAALYQQAGDDAKAIALLTAAMQRGQLDAKAYRTLYVTQINAGKLKDAVGVIDNGLAKGVIKPSEELVGDYSFIAQNAYADGDRGMAIDLYKRAAAISSTGDPLLNIAVILNNDGKLAEAADYARQALAKGVKNKAVADNILKAAGAKKKK